MTKIEELHYLVKLLDKHCLPISPVLEYAIKEKEVQYANEISVIKKDYKPNAVIKKDKELEDYCLSFENLSVGTSKGKKLPHKAIVLLSVMELISNGTINENRIELNDQIVLEFSKMWKKYMGDLKTPSVWTPFWYLKSESFWHFSPNGDENLLNGLLNFAGHPTIGQMRNVISFAYLDNELFYYILNDENRIQLQNSIKKVYLK